MLFLTPANSEPVAVGELVPGDVVTLDAEPGYGLQVAAFGKAPRSNTRRVLFTNQTHTLRVARTVWRWTRRDERVWPPVRKGNRP